MVVKIVALGYVLQHAMEDVKEVVLLRVQVTVLLLVLEGVKMEQRVDKQLLHQHLLRLEKVRLQELLKEL